MLDFKFRFTCKKMKIGIAGSVKNKQLLRAKISFQKKKKTFGSDKNKII